MEVDVDDDNRYQIELPKSKATKPKNRLQTNHSAI